MHQYECVAPNVDINLQSGRFWAGSIASFTFVQNNYQHLNNYLDGEITDLICKGSLTQAYRKLKKNQTYNKSYEKNEIYGKAIKRTYRICNGAADIGKTWNFFWEVPSNFFKSRPLVYTSKHGDWQTPKM